MSNPTPDINTRMTAVETKLVDFTKLAEIVSKYLVALICFAVVQTGSLIWMLAVSQTQQSHLQEVALDHEARLRQSELYVRSVRNNQP